MGALEDLLASGAGEDTDDTGTDDLGFIGMPKGYVATAPGTASRPTPGSPAAFAYAEHNGGQSTILPPRYQTGAELEPRSYSPENIALLQQSLAAAGLIGSSTKFRLGRWDAASITAYRKLLSYANQGGVSREDALAELMSQPLVDADGASGGRAPRGTRLDVLEVQDPATLRAAAHAAFKEATGRGRKVDDKVIDRFVKAFQGQQLGAQRGVVAARNEVDASNNALEDASVAGQQVADGPMSSEHVTSTPDMLARADEFARAQAPAEAGAHDVTKQFDSFLKLLGGII